MVNLGKLDNKWEAVFLCLTMQWFWRLRSWTLSPAWESLNPDTPPPPQLSKKGHLNLTSKRKTWWSFLKASDSNTFCYEHVYFILVLICTPDAADHKTNILLQPSPSVLIYFWQFCLTFFTWLPWYRRASGYRNTYMKPRLRGIKIRISAYKNITLYMHRAIPASKFALPCCLKQRWKLGPKGTKLLKVNALTHRHVMLEFSPVAQILTSVRSKGGFLPQKLYLLTWLKYELYKLFTN